MPQYKWNNWTSRSTRRIFVQLSGLPLFRLHSAQRTCPNHRASAQVWIAPIGVFTPKGNARLYLGVPCLLPVWFILRASSVYYEVQLEFDLHRKSLRYNLLL
jgi:hypothetical protein